MKKRLLSILLALTLMIPCISAMGITSNAAVVSSEGRLPFEDIEESHWAYDAAKFCYANGIIQGQGNTYTFAPSATLTREQFVTILARVVGDDLEVYIESDFEDVSGSEWYGPSVIWAHNEGYVLGVGDGTNFGVGMNINREQLAVMVNRFFEKIEIDITVPGNILDNYTDKNQISEWAIDGVKTIIAAKIMNSTSATALTFSPKKEVTRAEASLIFMSLAKNYIYADCEHEMVEATCTEGEYCTKCGLIFTLPNGHLCDTLSCKEGGVCNTCGEELAADAGLHEYSAGNCTTPEKCSVCGDVRKTNYAHNFTAATCTTAKTCTVCKVTEGAALGHTTKLGICTRCGSEVFSSKYWRVAYYMTVNATSNGDGTYEEGLIGEYNNGDIDSGVVAYDANNGAFALAYAYTWVDSGDVVIFAIDIPKASSTYEYVSMYCDSEGNLIYYAEGIVYPAAMAHEITYYEGNSADKSEFRDLTYACFKDCIAYTDEILNDICGESGEVFGFYN